MKMPYRSNYQLSQTNFGNTQFSVQTQSYPLINSVELEKYQQTLSEVNHVFNDNEIITHSKIFTRFEHHIMYPLLLKLLNHRDSLCYNTNLNELLSRNNELFVELSKISNINEININPDLDEEIRTCISTVANQIVEICSREEDFRNGLFEITNDMFEIISLQKELSYYSTSGVISYDNELSKKTTAHSVKSGKSKNVRQNMDPMAVLWFIKYLIDHKLEKPNKKHRYLLSLWTNVPEHDIDRWFIRTMGNYVKLNNAEKAVEKLKERAINTTRQLRKPNSLRTSGESRKAVSKRNLPYERPIRGRKGKQ
ncbi:hypothetical protein C1645_848889 [Glomus cerebriforme]|uniref:HD1-like protein n=1 Tax=Glomus cerebriforme TaxID=658196 RepID=A0A142BM09_9GLOM|nr:HD1-like protein [Glomus cerebriforme]RIA90684.1 hypothetical protein C1645_848889 [Glomus cerebriforme]